jgi:hypothetical protein
MRNKLKRARGDRPEAMPEFSRTALCKPFLQRQDTIPATRNRNNFTNEFMEDSLPTINACSFYRDPRQPMGAELKTPLDWKK